MRAVVVGGGIGGLAAAVAMRRAGLDVTVFERAPAFGEIGAGLTLMSNALRGLDVLGLRDAVVDGGVAEASVGTRTPDGRWLSRLRADEAASRLGATVVGIHRARLLQILLDALPPDVLQAGAEVVGVEAGPPATVGVVREGVEDMVEADVVVVADGIDSRLRSALLPGRGGTRYSGSTAWRAVTAEPWTEPLSPAITWGPGSEFGIVPLGDGRVYWYGATTMEPGARVDDEAAEVRRRFGGWHDPIARLMDATDPAAVIRHDLRDLATPLPTYVVGAAAVLGDAAHAMVPHLGQGACQAIEDAVVLGAAFSGGTPAAEALRRYDSERRSRSQWVAASARRIARIGQELRNPLAVRVRNAAIRATPPQVALRSMARFAAWEPPVYR
ncbi:MAG: FAD-dependent monooxygenase [Pseudonocardia sp.]|uniref:FAD-dependent monooxygenase n=1 Tax=unclassified Pseudonocardia TaxID=2619320 RepID=UPI000A77720E|nr:MULTISPECIES: FAD-dependent monooxygenase [unclassified Pseudonocardia]MBN9109626.1 FAD-dependent monooxygenase [Pseudonocardia sp.]